MYVIKIRSLQGDRLTSHSKNFTGPLIGAERMGIDALRKLLGIKRGVMNHDGCLRYGFFYKGVKVGAMEIRKL